MRLAELADKRVAVWGYGREGRAAVAVLRQHFPQKSLTLICPAAEGDRARARGDERLLVLSDPVDAQTLAGFDIVIKSPGISPYRAPYPQALAAGVNFTSGSALWFAEHAQARTICVTGTKGKSTVSALIAHLLRRRGLCVALAGNIGLSLLDLLQPPREPDWWVIELSSFQTRDFDGAPTIAVINNLYEEHLDWHGERKAYVADKLAIAARAQRVVVNAHQTELDSLAASGKRIRFNDEDGWHVRGDAIFRAGERILALAAIPLPGIHNAQNVCAALAAIEAAGEDSRLLAKHVASFKPLSHRLQTLGTRNGIEWINDSISTTPYAAIEALRSLTGRAVTILVGGFDRGLDWSPFVDFVAKAPPRAIVTMGANGAAIADALRHIVDSGFVLDSAPVLHEALARARTLTPVDGVILLSPGAPSFDQFHDYAERGREFARLAGFDPAAISEIEGLGIA
ncbi:MAG TPA: UDP-N-acetylmuramoyl-L-alanine--D-glutamate ligase [Rudaea sp.]|jgi:UDP-N-acetylmuramoylalanine--D-glutamate ligase|uniref:UDP-N-acetylmuramoyl-L-alanine--D-glutamate ligase n=1 Tax=Rudaea sp. TaxID=2136325 RepID=UPI002F951DE9